MSKLNKKLRNKNLIADVINAILGVALIVFIFLLVIMPRNRYILLSAVAIGGLMNISNGVKMIKQKKKTGMGWAFIMTGCIVMILGVFIVYSGLLDL